MKIFLTGATGFIGRYVLKNLLKAEHSIRILCRKGSEKKISEFITSNNHIEFHFGDIISKETLLNCMSDCDAAIHLVGIIREFPKKGITFEKIHIEATKNIIEEAKKASIKKIIFVSSLGSNPNSIIQYHKTKFLAEEIIRCSGIDYTIFKPSVVFGKEDKFINLIKKFVLPFFPIFIPGNGKALFQPISVEDLAYAIVSSIDMKNTSKMTYTAGGNKQISFNDLIKLIAKSKGVKIFFPIHIPSHIMSLIAKIGDIIPFIPITTEQLSMLSEDNVCNIEEFLMAFKIKLKTLEEYLGIL